MYRFTYVFFVLTTLVTSIASARDTCERQGHDTRLCREMRHFRSNLNVLEGQIEQSAINFELQEALAGSLEQMVSRILVRRGADPHFAALTNLRNEVIAMGTAARARDISVFTSTPLLKRSCQQCHAAGNDESPRFGRSWDAVSEDSWDIVRARCEQPGLNPVVCRKMHAMAHNLAYFTTAEAAQAQDLGATAAVADEIARVAQTLQGLSVGHGDAPLQTIAADARELAQLARTGGGERVWSQATALRARCISCHSAP